MHALVDTLVHTSDYAAVSFLLKALKGPAEKAAAYKSAQGPAPTGVLSRQGRERPDLKPDCVTLIAGDTFRYLLSRGVPSSLVFEAPKTL